MTVLAGYLPTPEGEAAFTAALAEARRRDEPLVVLNSPRDGAVVDPAAADDEQIADLLTRSRAAGVETDVRRDGRRGDLADEFLELADELDASVLVIGLRRRSAVGKLLTGSSSQRILLESDRPVLAVKPDRDD